MFLRILAILLMISSLASCGGKGAKDSTKANIVILGGIASGIPGMTGGTKIYGYNSATGETLNLTYTGQSAITLSNGPWGFSAVTWDGGFNGSETPVAQNNPMEGSVYCGSTDMFLAGGDVAVNLTLSHTGCNDDFFGGPEAKELDGQFKIFEPYKCIEDKNVHDTDDPCEASVALSYKVELPDGFGLPGLASRCIADQTGSSPEMSNSGSELRIPIIAFWDNSFAMKIRVYDDSTCTGTEQVFTIDNPYAGFSSPYAAKFDDSGSQGDGNPNYMRLHVDPCLHSVGTNTTNPYAVPSTSDRIVCNRDQFDNIETIDLAATYVLHRDLDFTGYGTFNNSVVSGTFTGTLKGRGHTISNINIQTTGISNIGIFSVLDGTPAIPTIEDINLLNIDLNVTDGSRVGALAGLVNPNTTIDRLQVTNVDIDTFDGGGSYNSIGGIIGDVAAVGYSEFHAWNILDVNIDVDIGYSNVGGVIGTLGNDNYFRFAKVHDVDIDSSASGSETSFGGVVGRMEGANSEIAGVAATNVDIGSVTPPSGNVSGVGGFVGTMMGGNIFLSKVKGNIISAATTATGNVGGFAGDITAEVADAVNIHSSITDVDVISDAGQTGGFAGQIFGNGSGINIQQSRSLGDVDACEDYCGGFVGYIRNISTGSLSINQSYTKSDVQSFDASALSFVGGFAGRMLTSSGPINVSEAFSTGYVSASAADYVGGFAGASDTVNISNVYSKSDVVAKIGASFVASFLGGGNAGSIEKIFASGTSTPGGNCINGSGASPINNNYCLAGNTGSPGGGPTYTTSITSKSATDILDLSSTDFAGDTVWSSLNESKLLFSKNTEAIGEDFTGTYFDPIILTTAAQWNAIGDDQFFMKKTYMLGGDISFTNGGCGTGFNPIGSTTYPFKGHFLGNNFTISDINCSETGGGQPLGLFRAIGDDPNDGAGSIQHYDLFDFSVSKALYVDNVHFDGDANSVGVIAGTVTDSGTNGGGHNDRHATRFTNIHVTNSSVIQNGAFHVGGLFGFMNLTNEHSRVYKSSFKNGSVTHNGTALTAGGLIGEIAGPLAETPTYTLDLAVLEFVGTVYAPSASATGGLIGQNSNLDTQIMFSSVDSTDITGGSNTGGFIGHLNGGTVRDSYAKANVTGSNLAGVFAGQVNNASPATIKGCYSEGNAHVASGTAAGFIGQVGGTPTIKRNIANATTSCSAGCTQYFFSPSDITINADGVNFQVGGADVDNSGTVVKAVTATELRDTNAMDLYGIEHGDPWFHNEGQIPVHFWILFPEVLQQF